eukprot:gene19155-biopygen10454
MHLDAGQRIQRGERFVEQQQLGLAHQAAGQCHALGLAAGEGRRVRLQPMGQPDFRQRLHRTGLGVGNPQAENHVFPGALPRHQAWLLEYRRPSLGHAQLAAVDAVQAREAAQQGGLAGTAGAQQRNELPRGDIQVQAVDDPLLAELAHHIAQLHRCC